MGFILSTKSKIPVRIYWESTSRVQYISGVEQFCMFLWSGSVDKRRNLWATSWESAGYSDKSRTDISSWDPSLRMQLCWAQRKNEMNIFIQWTNGPHWNVFHSCCSVIFIIYLIAWLADTIDAHLFCKNVLPTFVVWILN